MQENNLHLIKSECPVTSEQIEEFKKLLNSSMSPVTISGNVNKIKQINCKIDDGAILPKYETLYASGMDLKAWKYSLPENPNVIIDFIPEGIDLFPHERVKILTGLHIEFPENIEAQLRPRSGLTFKNGIITQLGTIDEDYRGDISLVVLNTSNKPFHIDKGDRLGQIVFAKVEKFDLVVTDELSKTLRGENGFNSTGIK